MIDSASLVRVAERVEAVLHVVLIQPAVRAPAARDVGAGAGDPLLGRGRTRNSVLASTEPADTEVLLRSTWFHVLPDVEERAHLEDAATRAGGTVRHVEEGASVIDILSSALDDFRTSYLLTYTAQGVAPGGWHDLRVELVGGPSYSVRARRGYDGGQILSVAADSRDIAVESPACAYSPSVCSRQSSPSP